MEKEEIDIVVEPPVKIVCTLEKVAPMCWSAKISVSGAEVTDAHEEVIATETTSEVALELLRRAAWKASRGR